MAVVNRVVLKALADIFVALGNVGRAGNMRMAFWFELVGDVMKNKLIRWAVAVLMVAALCFAFYQVGQTVGEGKAKIQIVEKEVEVIRYVEKKKAAIQSRPNAGRTDLLKLMHNNKL